MMDDTRQCQQAANAEWFFSFFFQNERRLYATSNMQITYRG